MFCLRKSGLLKLLKNVKLKITNLLPIQSISNLGHTFGAMSDDCITIESSDNDDVQVMGMLPANEENVLENHKVTEKRIDIVSVPSSKALLIQFLEKFKEVVREPAEDIERAIKKLWKGFNESDPSFTSSQLFQKLMQKAMNNVSSEPWCGIKNVYDELKYYSIKKRKSNESQPGSSSVTVSGSVTENGPLLDAKTAEHIKKLEKTMAKINRKILYLEKQEVDLNSSDEENSAYIQVSRYKERLVQIFNKITELRRKFSGTECSFKTIRFAGTKISAVNRAIEKFYNDRKEFPDFRDVLTVVKAVNEKKELHLPPSEIQSVAEKAFHELGENLKMRRQYDFHEVLMSYLPEDAKDPAAENDVLNGRLEENKRLYGNRIDEIINKYANRQMEENLEPTVIPSDVESPTENDYNDDEEDEMANVVTSISEYETDNESTTSVTYNCSQVPAMFKCRVVIPDVTTLPSWSLRKKSPSKDLMRETTSFHWDEPCCSKSLGIENTNTQKRSQIFTANEDVTNSKRMKLNNYSPNGSDYDSPIHEHTQSKVTVGKGSSEEEMHSIPKTSSSNAIMSAGEGKSTQPHDECTEVTVDRGLFVTNKSRFSEIKESEYINTSPNSTKSVIPKSASLHASMSNCKASNTLLKAEFSSLESTTRSSPDIKSGRCHSSDTEIIEEETVEQNLSRLEINKLVAWKMEQTENNTLKSCSPCAVENSNIGKIEMVESSNRLSDDKSNSRLPNSLAVVTNVLTNSISNCNALKNNEADVATPFSTSTVVESPESSYDVNASRKLSKKRQESCGSESNRVSTPPVTSSPIESSEYTCSSSLFVNVSSTVNGNSEKSDDSSTINNCKKPSLVVEIVSTSNENTNLAEDNEVHTDEHSFNDKSEDTNASNGDDEVMFIDEIPSVQKTTTDTKINVGDDEIIDVEKTDVAKQNNQDEVIDVEKLADTPIKLNSKKPVGLPTVNITDFVRKMNFRPVKNLSNKPITPKPPNSNSSSTLFPTRNIGSSNIRNQLVQYSHQRNPLGFQPGHVFLATSTPKSQQSNLTSVRPASTNTFFTNRRLRLDMQRTGRSSAFTNDWQRSQQQFASATQKRTMQTNEVKYVQRNQIITAKRTTTTVIEESVMRMMNATGSNSTNTMTNVRTARNMVQNSRTLIQGIHAGSRENMQQTQRLRNQRTTKPLSSDDVITLD